MKYILIIFFFYSCSSSRKIKTELHTISGLDSVGASHFDSTSLKKETSSSFKEVTAEYADNDTDTTVLYGVAGIEGLNLPTKGLRRINIRHSSSTAKIDSTKVVDNSFAETHSEIKQDAKTETEKKNSVKLPSFNLWGTVLGIGLPLLLGGGVWLFAWWRKRKKKKLP